MKRLTLILVFTLFGVSYAETDTSVLQPEGEAFVSVAPNIDQGNWNISGFLDVNMDDADTVSINMSLSSKYFLLNRLAVGASFGLDAGSESDTVSTLGPAATFYFWNNDYLAGYLGSSFRMGLTTATVNWVLSGELGLKYFMTPSVAIGPALYANYYKGDVRSFSRVGLLVNLGIFI